MAGAIRRSFCLGQPLQRVVSNGSKRFYAPRSTSFDSDPGNSVDRVPARLKRRLAKQGLSPEAVDMQTGLIRDSSQGLQQAAARHDQRPTAGPGDFDVGRLGQQEVTDLVKNMAGSAKASASESQSVPAEQFPSDIQALQDNKRRDQSRKAYRPRIDPGKTSLILFPGQGSQFVGMGQATLGYRRAGELFEEASAVLKYDLLKLCLSGPLPALSKTVHCQPAILVSSLAALEKLKEQNPEAVESCVGTAGFSVGEYAALVFAGVLSFADAVEVVRVRAEAMQEASEAVSSGMMTVFLSRQAELNTAMKAARDFCQQRCDITHPVCTVANFLYPECKVIAGHTQALDFVAKHSKTFGIRRTKRLPVSGAFHTTLMSAAKKPVTNILKNLTLSPPHIPVYCNVSASRLRKMERVGELMGRQVTDAVRWEQTMHVMYSRPQGQTFPHTYEVGPGNQLGVMLKLVNFKAFEKYTQVKV